MSLTPGGVKWMWDEKNLSDWQYKINVSTSQKGRAAAED